MFLVNRMSSPLHHPPLAPELTLLVTALAVLFIELGLHGRRKRHLNPIAIVGFLAALAFVAALAVDGTGRSSFGHMFVVDDFALAFKAFFLVVGVAVLLMSYRYFTEIRTYQGEYYFLVTSAFLGMLLMPSARDLVMLFIALELVSVPGFVMAAAKLLGRSAQELRLASYLTGATPRLIERPFGPESGRLELRRSQFRRDGKPHHLLVFADLSRALREEEQQAWQRIVRVLSHEINNSLTPIKSIAGSLESMLSKGNDDGDLKDDMKRGLAVIASRSDSLSRFTTAYAQLAKLPVAAEEHGHEGAAEGEGAPLPVIVAGIAGRRDDRQEVEGGAGQRVEDARPRTPCKLAFVFVRETHRL